MVSTSMLAAQRVGISRRMFSVLTVALASFVVFLSGCVGTVSARLENELTCSSTEQFFEQKVWTPLMSKVCIRCHTPSGLARDSRLHLDAADLTKTLQTVREVAGLEENGTSLLLLKPTAQVAHGGGEVLVPGSPSYKGPGTFGESVQRSQRCSGGTVTTCDPGDAQVSHIPARLRRLSRDEYDRSVSEIAGEPVFIAHKFVAEEVVRGYNNNANALRVGDLLAEQLMDGAEQVAALVVNRLSDHLICNPANGEEPCAKEFIERFGLRTFRRPLTQAEKDNLFVLYQQGRAGADFAAGINLVTQGMFQAPQFVYRSELGPDNAATGTVRMTSSEIGALLSYTITGGPPDFALIDAVNAGVLETPEGRVQQAKRLWETMHARPRFVDFVFQWLGINQIDFLEKNTEAFPDIFLKLNFRICATVCVRKPKPSR
ncbi:MAG: DUF1595 domain-containing protein [Myxococcota bacterium]